VVLHDYEHPIGYAASFGTGKPLGRGWPSKVIETTGMDRLAITPTQNEGETRMRVSASTLAGALTAVAVSSALVRQVAAATKPTSEYAEFSQRPLLGDPCYVGSMTTSVEGVSKRNIIALDQTKPVGPTKEGLAVIEQATGRTTVLGEQEGQGREVVASGVAMNAAAVCV
jgi:hypothetical protein